VNALLSGLRRSRQRHVVGVWLGSTRDPGKLNFLQLLLRFRRGPLFWNANDALAGEYA
jgi:hypothetical protein